MTIDFLYKPLFTQFCNLIRTIIYIFQLVTLLPEQTSSLVQLILYNLINYKQPITVICPPPPRKKKWSEKFHNSSKIYQIKKVMQYDQLQKVTINLQNLNKIYQAVSKESTVWPVWQMDGLTTLFLYPYPRSSRIQQALK